MTSELTQYINPIVEGKARQALRAHRAVSGVDSYKTVMCQTWLETAGCGFGPNCKFAHGEHELRPCRFPPPTFNLQKYKTKLCEKYTTRGICPYGRRCLFIHPEVTPLEDDAEGPLMALPSKPKLMAAADVNSPVGPASSDETTLSTKTGGGSGGDGSSGDYYRQPTPLFIPPPQASLHHQPQPSLQSHRHHSLSAVPMPKTLTAAASWPYFLDDPAADTKSYTWHVLNDGPLAEDQGYGDSGDGEMFPSRKAGRDGPIAGGDSLPPSQSRLSIWSSHEDVFDAGGVNESGHSLKDLRETLAFSLGNVLDLSDVRL